MRTSTSVKVGYVIADIKLGGNLRPNPERR
jgi:hypothetical protein